MSILTRVRDLWQRHVGTAGSDPVWDEQEQAEQAPTETMPAATPTEPHGIATPETLAAIREQAEADARAAQEAATTWQEADPVASLPVAALPDAPPMPPSDLSRAMVSQIPSPPLNDRNFGWRHDYADYLRRVGVATGTSTDLEHTMAWGIPALLPGDGTGEAL